MSTFAVELLKEASFLKTRQALDQGLVTSKELTEASLKRIDKTNSAINAFISVDKITALHEAEAADNRLKNGERGPLLGIPIAIKDLILVKDQKCTAASKMLSNFTAPYDATVITRLKKSGTPILGKTNLDEFAMGSSNESSYFGAVRNPWNLDLVPGGSSGGSAAAIASRCSILSLGTDTGGSIRQPSSLCGITGLKPTYGRVSRYGVVAFASSLDQVGPMCSDAQGCAAIMDAISGHCDHDSTSKNTAPTQSFKSVSEFLQKPQINKIRIGLPKEFFSSGLNPEVEKSIQTSLDFFKKNGAEIKEISLPHTQHALSTYYLICTSECSSNLARYDGIHYGYRSTKGIDNLFDLYANSRGEGFGTEVKLRILLGTFALSSGYYDAYFQKAAKLRRLIQNDFINAFKEVDVIAGPTSPFTAFKLGSKTKNPLEMYMADIYTLSTNLAGLPGLSFNVGYDANNLPIGLQLISRWWEEDTSLKMAAFYQNENKSTISGVTHELRI